MGKAKTFITDGLHLHSIKVPAIPAACPAQSVPNFATCPKCCSVDILAGHFLPIRGSGFLEVELKVRTASVCLTVLQKGV